MVPQLTRPHRHAFACMVPALAQNLRVDWYGWTAFGSTSRCRQACWVQHLVEHVRGRADVGPVHAAVHQAHARLLHLGQHAL